MCNNELLIDLKLFYLLFNFEEILKENYDFSDQILRKLE